MFLLEFRGIYRQSYVCENFNCIDYPTIVFVYIYIVSTLSNIECIYFVYSPLTIQSCVNPPPYLTLMVPYPFRWIVCNESAYMPAKAVQRRRLAVNHRRDQDPGTILDAKTMQTKFKYQKCKYLSSKHHIQSFLNSLFEYKLWLQNNLIDYAHTSLKS